MSRFIVRFGAVFLTFTIGVAVNFLINGVVERWIETPEPVLEEPSINVLIDLPRLTPSVATHPLVVTVGKDRSITLHGAQLGSLDDTSRLVATLNRIFTQRDEASAYILGFNLNSEVPEVQGSERTVLIKAPRWISYGEMTDLIDVIKTTGAQPIGLLGEGSRYPRFAIEQNR